MEESDDEIKAKIRKIEERPDYLDRPDLVARLNILEAKLRDRNREGWLHSFEWLNFLMIDFLF